MKSGVAPESSIRGKLDGKAAFSGVAPNQKNGGKNFGGGKQEGNSLREVWGRPALKTCFSKNFGANTGSNSLREWWGATRPKGGGPPPHTPSLHTLTCPKGFDNSLNNPHTDTPPP